MLAMTWWGKLWRRWLDLYNWVDGWSPDGADLSRGRMALGIGGGLLISGSGVALVIGFTLGVQVWTGSLPTAVAVLLALWGAVGAFALITARQAQAIRKPNRARRMERVLKQLKASFEESSELAELITSELDARSRTLERVRAEAEQWENLSRLHQAEAEAVARLVEAKVERGVRHLDRMGWVFAASGWLAAVLVGVYAEFLVIRR
jgi:hypothetical protein